MRPYDQIFLLGDSLTELSTSQEHGFSYNAALQNAYIRRLDVVNRGCGGYTTAHAMKMLPDLFPHPDNGRIQLFILWFGANDSCLPHSFQHVPLSAFKTNLRAISSYPALLKHNPKIIFVTPPPVELHTRDVFDVAQGHKPMRLAEITAEYAKAVKEVAMETKESACIDLWGLMMREAGWKEGETLSGSQEEKKNDWLAERLYDGLHLDGKAYKMLFSEIMATVQEKFPEILPENLPMVYPFCLDAPFKIDILSKSPSDALVVDSC